MKRLNNLKVNKITTYCDNCGERGSGRNSENLCPRCAKIEKGLCPECDKIMNQDNIRYFIQDTIKYKQTWGLCFGKGDNHLESIFIPIKTEKVEKQ